MSDTPETDKAKFTTYSTRHMKYIEAVDVEFARAQERLAGKLRMTRDRATFPKHRQDPATWVLYLLAHGEISVGKAAEWLRDYICYDKRGSLPKGDALP